MTLTLLSAALAAESPDTRLLESVFIVVAAACAAAARGLAVRPTVSMVASNAMAMPARRDVAVAVDVTLLPASHCLVVAL